MQLGFFDSLHKWLATMVNLKFSGRDNGVKLMQYLREGLVLHLFETVVLKSGGGCILLRSSMTEAERVRRGQERERRVKTRREIAEMEEEEEEEAIERSL
ncbi:hypothetical protein RHMOL_Rhmol04G0152000 [Rhododendron molle]|uniref:Uncharacterized protein n=1 Tax=Rhododendron molle TaxID=49168 RepID=A0ACC0P1X7_RHOML|nr:hypothetical protein RHMOL_Rhmol04G0152000 [Rhododendron molle]